MGKNHYQKIAFFLIVGGGVFLVISSLLFLLKSSSPISLGKSSTIDSTILNDFGSLTAGTVGILWSLAGVFLLIASLQEQKRATDENIKSIRLQQFENTFFQLISVHYQIVNSLRIVFQDDSGIPEKDEMGNKDAKNGTVCFVSLAELISKKYKADKSKNASTVNFNDVCLEQFYIYNAELGHYFGNFFNILNYIDSSKDISNEDKYKYINILKNQLSNYELVIILYYDLIKLNFSRRTIIEKYCLFENLDFENNYDDKYEKILIDLDIFIDKYPHLYKCFSSNDELV